MTAGSAVLSVLVGECVSGRGSAEQRRAEHTYRILDEQAGSCQNGREGLSENHSFTIRGLSLASLVDDCGRPKRGPDWRVVVSGAGAAPGTKSRRDVSPEPVLAQTVGGGWVAGRQVSQVRPGTKRDSAGIIE